MRSLAAALSTLLVACMPAPTLPASLSPAGAPSPDSTGAVIDLHLDETGLLVRALYVNADDRRGALTYQLDVTRGGRSRSTNRQSGRFTTAPGQTDTLSTTRVSVQAGDPVSIRLTVSDSDGVVDEVHLDPALP